MWINLCEKHFQLGRTPCWGKIVAKMWPNFCLNNANLEAISQTKLSPWGPSERELSVKDLVGEIGTKLKVSFSPWTNCVFVGCNILITSPKIALAVNPRLVWLLLGFLIVLQSFELSQDLYSFYTFNNSGKSTDLFVIASNYQSYNCIVFNIWKLVLLWFLAFFANLLFIEYRTVTELWFFFSVSKFESLSDLLL